MAEEGIGEIRAFEYSERERQEEKKAFDFLVIDMLWWRNSKRIRFTGTENIRNIYKSPRKHLISFVKGILIFLIIAVIDGFLLSLI